MENLQFQLIEQTSDARERHFERKCEGLQNEILSPVIMRTGREIHYSASLMPSGAFIACMYNEQREVQIFARLVPANLFTSSDATLLDYVDRLGWWGTRTLEISALVINRCPFDGDEAQLQWRQSLTVALFANLESHLEARRINRLLLLTQRPLLPTFATCTYPSKRVHTGQAQYNCLYFGFRMSPIDRSPYVPALEERAFGLANHASTIISKW